MNKKKIKKLESMAESRFLSLFNVIYNDKNGKERSWIVASRKSYDVLKEQFFDNKEDERDAVVILAFHKIEKKLVMIKQFRVPINSYVYELPAGLIDPKEDIMSTLTRELKEETGLNVLEVLNRNDKSNLYLSPGMTDESAALIYCLCDGEISSEYLEPDEDIEAMLISREKAAEILESGAKLDIKCYMALKTFVQFGEEMFN